MNQSVSIIYIENKAQLLMQIAQEFKDTDINLFLDLVSIYTAMCSSTELVKEVQDVIYDQEVKLLELTEDVHKLTEML
jgi:hypothetical protein|tara:strand:- start:1657 stop:1890 length:234 start_codon:yes stop_codon:yes gene_type:complete